MSMVEWRTNVLYRNCHCCGAGGTEMVQQWQKLFFFLTLRADAKEIEPVAYDPIPRALGHFLA